MTPYQAFMHYSHNPRGMGYGTIIYEYCKGSMQFPVNRGNDGEGTYGNYGDCAECGRTFRTYRGSSVPKHKVPATSTGDDDARD